MSVKPILVPYEPCRGRKGWKKAILDSISEKVERRIPSCKMLIVN